MQNLMRIGYGTLILKAVNGEDLTLTLTVTESQTRLQLTTQLTMQKAQISYSSLEEEGLSY